MEEAAMKIERFVEQIQAKGEFYDLWYGVYLLMDESEPANQHVKQRTTLLALAKDEKDARIIAERTPAEGGEIEISAHGRPTREFLNLATGSIRCQPWEVR
jgi:hypothetical protein